MSCANPGRRPSADRVRMENALRSLFQRGARLDWDWPTTFSALLDLKEAQVGRLVAAGRKPKLAGKLFSSALKAAASSLGVRSLQVEAILRGVRSLQWRRIKTGDNAMCRRKSREASTVSGSVLVEVLGCIALVLVGYLTLWVMFDLPDGFPAPPELPEEVIQMEGGVKMSGKVTTLAAGKRLIRELPVISMPHRLRQRSVVLEIDGEEGAIYARLKGCVKRVRVVGPDRLHLKLRHLYGVADAVQLEMEFSPESAKTEGGGE